MSEGPARPTPGAGTRAWVVDPHRCAMCARTTAGLRCDQCITIGYERQLVRARTAQQPSVPPASGAARQDAPAWPASAPCGDACPLSLCVQGYSNHIAAGEYVEALRHIMVRTPLPESVCRVCDRPCEGVCVRALSDESVAINDLKRFVVEWAAAQPVWPWSPAPAPEHGGRVAVVGAGPAGLSAAADLRLRGYAVTIFEASDRPGGVLALCIPEYRLPEQALEADIARVRALGVEIVLSTALGRDLTIGGLLDEGWDALFIAVGAHRPKALVLEGAGEPGCPPQVAALDWLRSVRAGTDAPLRGDVVVIGGGNAAIDAARSALRRGAARVRVACIEERARMPALPEEVLAAQREGVAIHAGMRPLRAAPGAVVFGAAEGGAAGELRLEADQVIVAIGQDPGRGYLEGAGVELDCDAAGVLEVQPETMRTSDPRVFAGGDVCTSERTVTAAMAAGLRAAWAIDRQVRGAELADVRRPPLHPRRPSAPLAAVRTRHVARRHPAQVPVAERSRSFVEVVGALGEREARQEAARCLVCGLCGNCRACIDLFGCPALTLQGSKVVIDASLCNGCGVCADFCPNGAIRPAAEEEGDA